MHVHPSESELELVVRDDHPTYLVRRWHVDDASSWHSSDWRIEGAVNVCEVIKWAQGSASDAPVEVFHHWSQRLDGPNGVEMVVAAVRLFGTDPIGGRGHETSISASS